MIHQWKKALLEGAADIFERGGKKTAEINECAVRDLHARIGELAVANDFLSRKLSPRNLSKQRGGAQWAAKTASKNAIRIWLANSM
jgi:hypothetical protein